MQYSFKEHNNSLNHIIYLNDTLPLDYGVLFKWLDKNIGRRLIDWKYHSIFSQTKIFNGTNFKFAFLFKTKDQALRFKLYWS